MRVWIDLANSPHPLFFAPIVRRLRGDGHEVLLTARDNAQTLELARERWPEVDAVGGPSPGGRAAKAQTLGNRIADLRRYALRIRPDVALSHNSYAQIAAATLARVPAVTAMDYEHQPANHLAFRLARRVLLPEPLRAAKLRRQGAGEAKVRRYPGLKEELYVGDFEPDRDILAKLGIAERPRTLAVLRTPPSRAVYHRGSNPLFVRVLQTLCAQPELVSVVLSRHPEQTAELEELALARCVVPRTAVDARSLMHAADVMVGAGGTMTREAALLGIPTWTVFAGEPATVDSWLVREGLLRRLTDPGQLAAAPAPHRRTPAQLRVRARAIEDVIVDSTLAVARR